MSKESMNINWFPGHMKKTREEIQKNLRLVDMVLELVDARAPISSKNPDIEKLIQSKPKILLLNKRDLTTTESVDMAISYYEKNYGITPIAIDSTNKSGYNKMMSAIKKIEDEIYEKNKAKGLKRRPLRMMIVGIPNVGKSTLINKVIGRKSAKTGDRPGVTKGQQWVKLKNEVELLDTPGVLWPKFEDQDVGERLSFIGSIKDQIVEIEEIYFALLKFLIANDLHKDIFEQFSIGIDTTDIEEISEKIAQKRGFLQKGAQVDYNRLSNEFINDFRMGKFGKIQLDMDKLSQK